MTDILITALNMADKDDDIPIDDQILVDWLNDKVEVLGVINAAIKNSPKSCYMGTIIDGEYEVEVDACGWVDRTVDEVHIFQGIKYLAEAVGAEINQRPFLDTKVEYFFTYRYIKFFEICDAGEELR